VEDGHANHAAPHFKHALTMGFSGAIQVETDKQDELQALEEWMSELDDMLLCNPHFVNLTEGVTAMDRVGQYSKVGEVTLYEIRVEMTMEFSSTFPPVVIDDLKRVVVDTQFPDKEHADAGTPQLHREYELDTGTKSANNP
jgi:hypothetical protein